MSKESNKDIKFEIPYLFLFSGKDFKVGDFTLKHPTVEDILSIDGIHQEEIYWSMVSVLLSDPYENMVELDDMGLDYEEVTSFDLFCMNWNKQVELYQENKEQFDTTGYNPLNIIKRALSFFLGERDWDLLELLNGSYILYDKSDTDYQIDSNTFMVIGEWIKAVNCIEYKDRIKPKNKFVKEALIDDMRMEKQIREKTKDESEKINVLGSMLSAICVGGNGSITPFNMNKLSIFQVYQYFVIEQKKTRVDKLLNGVYAGTIDSKQISESEYKWTV